MDLNDIHYKLGEIESTVLATHELVKSNQGRLDVLEKDVGSIRRWQSAVMAVFTAIGSIATLVWNKTVA